MVKLRTRESEVRTLAETRDVSFPQMLSLLWGSPSLQFNDYRSSFSGLKRPGSEVDRSLTPKVKKECRFTSISLPFRMPLWSGDEQLYLIYHHLVLQHFCVMYRIFATWKNALNFKEMLKDKQTRSGDFIVCRR